MPLLDVLGGVEDGSIVAMTRTVTADAGIFLTLVIEDASITVDTIPDTFIRQVGVVVLVVYSHDLNLVVHYRPVKTVNPPGGLVCDPEGPCTQNLPISATDRMPMRCL